MKFAFDWNYKIPICNTSFNKSYTDTLEESTELEYMELRKLLESKTQPIKLKVWSI
jgi:hypothetical protein